MQQAPFTYDEAEEIAEDFEDLADTSFRTAEGAVYSIDNVLACPFDAKEQALFTGLYLKTGNKNEALATYNVKDFDVIVLAYTETEDKDYKAFDIRSFAELRGIKYSFPR
jgi:hypothetical protein